MTKTMTEKEYRDLPLNSSSSLKDFLIDRRKYYKKYILKETVKEKPNKSSDMGRLVETLLMEPDRFDELFFMSSLTEVPGGMMGDFIVYLAQAVGAEDPEDVDDDKFEELAKEAHKKSGFKWKLPAVLKKFEEPENELYYSECLKVEALKMTMVTPQDIENAEKIVTELKTNPFLGWISTTTTTKKVEVINQMKIPEFFINGLRLKAMLDKVIINHEINEVRIFDLKCTWAVENFYKEYYLFRRAYIQAYLYWRAVLYLSETDTECSFYGYKINPPEFLVCDSINYYKPLLYTLTDKDLGDAYVGFEHKFTKYPGVKDIIEDLQWAIDKDLWTISRTNWENNAIVNIKD